MFSNKYSIGLSFAFRVLLELSYGNYLETKRSLKMKINSIKLICITFVIACIIQVFPSASFADDRSMIEYYAKSIKVISGARMRLSRAE